MFGLGELRGIAGLRVILRRARLAGHGALDALGQGLEHQRSPEREDRFDGKRLRQRRRVLAVNHARIEILLRPVQRGAY